MNWIVLKRIEFSTLNYISDDEVNFTIQMRSDMEQVIAKLFSAIAESMRFDVDQIEEILKEAT